MDRLRVAVRYPSFVRHPVGIGWALVGDAGYYRDAITGHGITDAFRDAELLAAAVGAWLRGAEPETVAMHRYAIEREAGLRPIFDYDGNEAVTTRTGSGVASHSAGVDPPRREELPGMRDGRNGRLRLEDRRFSARHEAIGAANRHGVGDGVTVAPKAPGD